MADTQGWEFETCKLHRNRVCAYVRKKLFVFYYVAVICTITKQKEQIRACVIHYDQSAWTANWWRSSKRSTYCKHRCETVLAQKNETENQWCIIKSAKSSTMKLDCFEIWLRKSILNVHNYLQRWWTQPKKSPVLKHPLKNTVKPTKIQLLTFPLKNEPWSKK